MNKNKLKQDDILYSMIDHKRIKDRTPHFSKGSQYYDKFPEICEYFMRKSGGPWSDWHELNERYHRQELRKFGRHKVFQFCNQSYEMMVFTTFLMDKWWKAMQQQHCHVGITYSEFEDELEIDYDKTDAKDKKEDTIKKNINHGIDEQIIGCISSTFDKRVKKYFPMPDMLEFYIMKSRHRWMFFQKNNVRDKGDRIAQRLSENRNSGLFKHDGRFVWDLPDFEYNNVEKITPKN